MSEVKYDLLRKLGLETKRIRKEVSKIVKEGIDITEIIDFVEKEIFSKGYFPAFPCTVSVNDVAAHYTVFDEKCFLKKGDVIKIDFGIMFEGHITDNAFTIEVNSNEHETLLNIARQCLEKALDKMEVGERLNLVGREVDSFARANSFNSIHNLSGHQIGLYDLHCGLSVPSYDNGKSSIIENGMQFAVEPFITYGEPKVKSSGPGNILHLINDKPIRDPIAKKVLNEIKEFFPKLPFSKRWLINDIVTKNLGGTPPFKGLDKRKVLYGLKVLKANNIVYEYDALSTIDGKIVAQFEDSIVFNDNKKEIITR